jgi:hypothetical protein
VISILLTLTYQNSVHSHKIQHSPIPHLTSSAPDSIAFHLFAHHIKLGSPWSCQLWYQHPSRLLTLWTKLDSGLLQGIFEYRCREQTQGGRVMSCLLIWLISVKLGLWSCQLWCQHPLQLLTLWTKQDSGLLWGIFDYRCQEQTQGGRVSSCYLILFLSIKLGSWSCWLWYQHSSWLLALWTKLDSG